MYVSVSKKQYEPHVQVPKCAQAISASHMGEDKKEKEIEQKILSLPC
jgi:hypothetical protein